MMIARWSVTARFGHRDAVIAAMKGWNESVGKQIGAKGQRILSGSVGVRESEVQIETEIRDMAELQAIFDKLPGIAAQAEWTGKLEDHVVSGSNRWEVFRVVG